MKKSEPPAVTSHVIKMYLNKQTHSKKKSNLSYLNFNPSLNLREGQKKTKKKKHFNPSLNLREGQKKTKKRNKKSKRTSKRKTRNEK